MLKVTRKGMTMLTNEERIRALFGNLKNWDWTVFPQYRLEKEDAAALMELLNNAKEKNNE